MAEIAGLDDAGLDIDGLDIDSRLVQRTNTRFAAAGPRVWNSLPTQL